MFYLCQVLLQNGADPRLYADDGQNPEQVTNYIKYIKDRYIYSTVVDQAMSYNIICFHFYITCIYIYFILLTIYVNAKIEFILMYAFIIVLPLVFKTSITGFKIISF